MAIKQRYKLYISVLARERLNDIQSKLLGDKNKNSSTRSNLADYFHTDYIDSRSDELKQEKRFAQYSKDYETTVILSNAQVESIVLMAYDLDLDMLPPRSRESGRKITELGIKLYLLSTFLEAVLTGELIPNE